ncbi:hypothetical protein IX317_001121 [Fusobacterium sp. DD29]|uniref:hypothetical protein n=1 Tax=unclassified Fusobacterium TaxID=2648384 RepID=UPI001B8BA41A|nr:MULTISPECIES: hypothetical protein [unclassified Fusobacterium]MBR8701319.1 hypothetical protein [Fusobacterium sp. DD45]MBR8711065.1 hypothetical protein [Fusobacterium sp. DD28]MBR8749447.1 hypothetical protein [Fusobacterium sp. DD29]MBR8751639.1 hypothetical protein [Fusobacterium sp. DD26]MBR8761663.1 hypothetical protein [Fusobacterium sp. DD25]
MILYDKILKTYSKKELNEMADPRTARKIYYARGTIPLEKAAKIFNLDKIKYTVEDAIKDYNIDKSYKQYKYAFKIFKKGYSIRGISEKYGLTDALSYQLKREINFTSKAINSHYIIDILDIKVDISNFTFDIYEDHLELFGDKNDLIKFKEKYNINYDIIFEPFKKQWHIAFDGMLCDWIKLHK